MSWKANMQTETYKFMLKICLCNAIKLFIHGNIRLDKYFLNHPPMTAVLKFHCWNIYQLHAYLYWISLGDILDMASSRLLHLNISIKLRWLNKV